MELKKHPQADLEKKRGLFMQIGLVAALAIVWIALEWKSYEQNAFNLGDLMMEDIEEEIIPITEREIKPPPPPPPPEELIIVEDEEELEEELEVEDTEVDEDTEIEEIEEEEEFDEQQIFTVVEQMPVFPGGDAALMSYIAKNIKYPAMAKESGISGAVYITFVINQQGEIKDAKVIRGIGGGCDKEALRVVKKMPKWKAGKQRGKPVRVQYNLPVRFVLR